MSNPRVRIIFLSRFRRAYKPLHKRYPQVDDTLREVLDKIRGGDTPGDRIQGISPYTAYKVRIPNKDAGKGKSGGFRVLYYVRTAERVYLISIYSKGEIENLSAADIRRMIDESQNEIEND